MLSNKDFDHINEAGLAQLIEARVSEGILTEYKSAAYNRTDAGTKEFLKDITSFANTSGGHLIIGMQEVAGIATEISAIGDIDPDKELQRLESLARDGIEPRITGIRMKAIPTSGGRADRSGRCR